MSEPKQCRETVSIRDTWRYSGRGRGGFSMRYTRRPCRRFVRAEEEYCWQHRTADARQGTTDAGAEEREGQ